MISTLLATLLALPLSLQAPAEAEAAGPPKLAFEDESSQKSFLSGFQKFEDGAWKDAIADFKLALKGVEKKDKKALESYVAAAKDGPKVDGIADLISSSKYRKAYSQLVRLEKKQGDGPLVPRLSMFFEELDKTLFHVLDNYEPKEGEDPAKKLEQDPTGGMAGFFGRREINKNPKYVRRGKQSMKWKATGGRETFGYRAALTFVRLDEELLEKHRYLHLSVRGPKAAKATVVLSLDRSDDAGIQIPTMLEKKTDFFKTVVPKDDWIDLRIDLRSAKIRKVFAANEIKGLRIQMVAPQDSQTMYIDEVKLEIP